MAERSDSDAAAKALLGVSSVVRGLLSAASRDEVMARHRVGAILCELKKLPGKYGDRAIDKVAAEVGVAATTLYRYAAVAEQWTHEDMKADLAKTNRFGQPLTWTHFVALSRVSRVPARRVLFETALANAWSARDLSGEVDAAQATERGPARGASPVRAALKEGIQSATRASTDVGIFAEGLSRRLSDLDGDADAELVARAIEVFHELTQRAEETLSQLKAVRDSEKHLRVGATSPAAGSETAEELVEEEAETPGLKKRSGWAGKPRL